MRSTDTLVWSERAVEKSVCSRSGVKRSVMGGACTVQGLGFTVYG